jgi:hypothetical protein
MARGLVSGRMISEIDDFLRRCSWRQLAAWRRDAAHRGRSDYCRAGTSLMPNSNNSLKTLPAAIPRCWWRTRVIAGAALSEGPAGVALIHDVKHAHQAWATIIELLFGKAASNSSLRLQGQPPCAS